VSHDSEMLSRARSVAGRAFEEWIPRRCDPAWLDFVSCPARFTWDVDAIQRGFIDPLYDCFDARPEHYRPSLTACLLETVGVEPGCHSLVLVASELPYLATLIVQCLRNGRTVRESMPEQTTIPIPVLVTVAYTARQMAASLVIDHGTSLAGDARTWLAYRVGHALSQSGAGRAVDFAGAGGRLTQGTALLEYMRFFLTPLTFVLPVDCALAAIGAQGQPFAQPLREAAGCAGIAYRIAVALRPTTRSFERYPVEPTLHCLAADVRDGEFAGRLVSLAVAQRRAAEEALRAVPSDLASGFEHFLRHVVDKSLQEMTGEADGRGI